MPNLPELVPSKELFARWESGAIGWEEFREGFTKEMRTEFKGAKSKLKGLTDYSLANDVTLLSPEPSGEQTYRAILEEIINQIWEREGVTDRVINLAQRPVEHPQQSELKQALAAKDEKIRSLDDEIKSLQAEIQKKDTENDTLKAQIEQLQEQLATHTETIKSHEEILSNKDDEIKSLHAEINTKDKDLKAQTDQLQEQLTTHTETIKSHEETLSNKDDEIKSLQAEINTKDTDLKAQTDQLQAQIATHTENIKSQEEIISTKDTEIKSLKAENRKKDKDVAQLQAQIDDHQKIRDIAIEGIEDKKLEKYFRNLKIDENLPLELCKWLEGRLKKILNSPDTLFKLIEQCITDKILSRDDAGFAHSIRKQRNLFSHDPPIDEQTKMGRVLYCYLAAALVFPQLPELE